MRLELWNIFLWESRLLHYKSLQKSATTTQKPKKLKKEIWIIELASLVSV